MASSFKKYLVEMVRKAREKNDLDADLFVDDHLDDAESRHQIPEKEEIVFGPTQASSGEGAVRMTDEYSRPAPQQAITEEYIRFNRYIDKRLSPVEKSVKQLASVLSGMVAAIDKAEHEENGNDSEVKELMEMAEKAMKKARLALFKAEEDDDEDDEAVEESVISAEKSIKSALAALKKAEEERDEDEDNDERMEKARKSIRSLKSRVKIIKAKKEDEGNQGDGVDPKNGNQADAAKSLEAAVLGVLQRAGVIRAETEEEGRAREASEKAEIEKSNGTGEDVHKAVNDLSMQVASVSDLLKALMGQSRGIAPVFQKAEAGVMLKSRVQALRDAIDNEDLNDSDTCMAQRLMSRIVAAQDGAISADVVEAEMARMPSTVLRLIAA